MLLGIDSGQTALKAVLFSDDGRELGSASRPSASLTPRPHWVERDAEALRVQLFEVIAEVLSTTATRPADVTAVGVVGHGDGLYFVGDDGRASREAILAVDTRAESVLDEWRVHGVIERAVALTGQEPFAASLAPLTHWLLVNEPEALARTRWLLACKDWLRYCLTGEIATDFSEGNSSVGRLDGLDYSQEALEQYGIEAIASKLPPLRRPTEVAGGITAVAAERSGLAIGTPVVIGTHDAVAAILGVGAGGPGELSALAGTYSVNHLVSTDRIVDPRWQARPWVESGRWVLMGASPASVTNFEWYLRTQMSEVRDPVAVANREVAEALTEESRLVFHPFLYGSPEGGHASGSLLGLQGWHSRRHVLRAIWEGIVFNHRTHLDALGRGRPRERIRLAGGASKSAVWTQLFADGLGCVVEVTESSEPGALGAAMLAGIGTGVYPSIEAAEAAVVHRAASFEPHESQRPRWEEAFGRYTETVDALRPLRHLFD
ncbi:FGGY-family carbohydrate kinase [Herbiconiux solani]|uniref:FGGY-family carbohydrate kinase n=1 Tax=Herbiconiux solani TaxID=661329 RepID=UPI0008243431|nr:FGGY-family carbohydrate kinase [Herbiconiux solani]